MGKNGRLRVTAHWTFTGDASVKTPRIRVGPSGNAIYARNTTDSGEIQIVVAELCNRNSESAQLIGTTQTLTGKGGNITVFGSDLTVDTTVPWLVKISGQLADSADTMRLQSYMVEVLNAR
jgi:hypothetical protein